MKQLDKIANQINKLAELDIFTNTRKVEYVEARSLFSVIAYKYIGVNLIGIARYLKSKGKDSDHSTVLHSFKNFEMYAKYTPILYVWLEDIVKEVDDIKFQQKQKIVSHKVKQLTEKNLETLIQLLEPIYEQNKLDLEQEVLEEQKESKILANNR